MKNKIRYGINRKEKMIFTYLIQYDGIDGFGSVDFCAESKNEAINLFNQWCVANNKIMKPVSIKNIEIIYNESDAQEYGDRYGKGKGILNEYIK